MRATFVRVVNQYEIQSELAVGRTLMPPLTRVLAQQVTLALLERLSQCHVQLEHTSLQQGNQYVYHARMANTVARLGSALQVALAQMAMFA